MRSKMIRRVRDRMPASANRRDDTPRGIPRSFDCAHKFRSDARKPAIHHARRASRRLKHGWARRLREGRGSTWLAHAPTTGGNSGRRPPVYRVERGAPETTGSRLDPYFTVIAGVVSRNELGYDSAAPLTTVVCKA